MKIKKMKNKFIAVIVLIMLIFNSCIQYNTVKAIGTEEDMEIIKEYNMIHKENIKGVIEIVQLFELKLKDEVSEYNISISDFPEGTRVLDMSNNEINKMKEGIFKIAIPQNNIGRELKGNININDHIYAFNKETNNSEVKVKAVEKDGRITQNAIIELKQGETLISTQYTNEAGETIFSNLYPGYYQIYEKDATGSMLLDYPMSFSLLYDSEIELRLINTKQNNLNITVQNEKKKGTIEIHVIDAENSEIKLKNVEIEISHYAGEVIETLRTNENGIAVSSRLPIEPTYSVKQKNTAENYNMNFAMQTIKFSENGENIILEFKNVLKTNFIKITKVDKDNNEIKLEGVVFGIYNSDDELIEEITTNNKGEAVSSNLPVNKEYKIKEIKALDNYVLDTNVITVYLTENGENTLDQNEEENKIGLKTRNKKEVIRLSSQKNFLVVENQKVYTSLPKLGC